MTAEKVKAETLILKDPLDLHIPTMTDMPRPKTKNDIQTLCGCISSLQAWFPNVSYHIGNLRAACIPNKTFEQKKIREKQFNELKKNLAREDTRLPFLLKELL